MTSHVFHRHSIAIVLGSMLLGACGPRSETQPPAKMMEAVLAPVLPKKLGDGVVFRSAVAEGDMLVVTIAGPSDMTEVWSEAEIGKMASVGFCQAEHAARFFEKGGKLRFDISSGGDPPVEGAMLDHCPNG